MKRVFSILLPLALLLSLFMMATPASASLSIPPTLGSPLASEPSVPSAPSLEFYQMNFDLDGTVTHNTDWGRVRLTFTGSTDIMYFNLVVNSSWQIQNAVVLSIEGSGVTQTQSFFFDLGNPVGVEVTSVTYTYDLTTSYLTSPPAGSTIASVGDGWTVLYSGAADAPLDPVPKPAPFRITGPVVPGMSHRKEGVPNQERGYNECVPAAVSNVLKHLEKRHGLKMPPNDIETMKDATNWDHEGCWIWPDPTRPAGERNAWWQDKDDYMKQHNYPVSTRQFPAVLRRDDLETVDWETVLKDVFEELKDCQGIEMECAGHTVTVVGMTKLETGHWVITYKHDDKPNQDGGLETESMAFDPTTGKFPDGPTWARCLNYFVVQCPITPITVGGEHLPVDKLSVMVPWLASLAAIIGGASLLVLRRRRAQI